MVAALAPAPLAPRRHLEGHNSNSKIFPLHHRDQLYFVELDKGVPWDKPYLRRSIQRTIYRDFPTHLHYGQQRHNFPVRIRWQYWASHGPSHAAAARNRHWTTELTDANFERALALLERDGCGSVLEIDDFEPGPACYGAVTPNRPLPRSGPGHGQVGRARSGLENMARRLLQRG